MQPSDHQKHMGDVQCSCELPSRRPIAAVATPSRRPEPGADANAAALCHDKSGGHRQRLHLPLRQPPSDVRRHQGGRDRHRSHQLRPAAGGQTYVDEIQKITKAPIKYLIYSHHHYDHIAGGKAFKDAGAKVVAHRRAKERLATLKDLDMVIPDEVGRRQARHHPGRHHARAALHRHEPLGLVAGDAAPQGKDHFRRRLQFPWRRALAARGINDFYPMEWEASLKRMLAMEWERHDPGSSRTRRPARHQGGHASSSSPSCRSFRRGAEGCRRGQVLVAGGEGAEAARSTSHWAGYEQNLPLERAPLVRATGAAAPRQRRIPRIGDAGRTTRRHLFCGRPAVRL